MPRALTIRRTVVPAADRAKHLARLRAKRDHYGARHCRFWAFEEASIRGAFLEFVEADSADTLAAAHADVTDGPADAHRVYLEVELD